MNKAIGIVLLVVGLILGYLGIQQFDQSTNSAEVLGIEIKANDKGGQQTGVIELILAVALFGGGLYTLSRKSA
jgi:hypothetical protein